MSWIKPFKRQLIAGIVLSGLVSGLHAEEILRIGVSDSDNPPIAVVDQNTLTGGLANDIGNALAAQMGMHATFIVVSRNRVEHALQQGKFDLICNANPAWYEHASQFAWSLPVYSKIERILSRHDMDDIHTISGLTGLRIATIRGYQYPSLTAMWAQHQARQNIENAFGLMVKSVVRNLSDVAIVSELEYADWANKHDLWARQLKLQPMVFSTTPTMCAISPKSTVELVTVNRAIRQLQEKKIIQTFVAQYSAGNDQP